VNPTQPGRRGGWPALWLAVGLGWTTSCAVREPAPVTGLDGQPVAIQSVTGPVATVWVFVAVDCPIANRCLPELERLRLELAPQGIGWVYVYPSPFETTEQIERHRQEYGVRGLALRDPEWTLARRWETTRVPEAVVTAPGGRRLYQGRIHDQFTGLGQGRPAPTRPDLAEALREVVAGKPVSQPRVPTIGCSFRAP
jgi:hypothetical protein